RVADEELLLRLGPVLEEGRDEHARPLPHHLAGGLRAAQLLGDDRRLERVGRLLRATVAPGDVAVEGSAVDRLPAERRPARVGAGPSGEGVEVGLARGVLRLPVLGEEAAHLGAERFVFGAVAQVHALVPTRFAVRETNPNGAPRTSCRAAGDRGGRGLSRAAR